MYSRMPAENQAPVWELSRTTKARSHGCSVAACNSRRLSESFGRDFHKAVAARSSAHPTTRLSA